MAAQYLDWIGRAARLDFGVSLVYHRPVAELVRQRAANTAILALAALLLATLLGLPAGIVTGSRRRGLASSAIRGASIVLLSLPSLITSLLLVLVAARTGWLPTGGMQSAGAWDGGTLAGLADLARHLPLPALAIALPLAAMIERVQSQSLGAVLKMPFALATLARGVPRGRLVWRDAWRPAVGPVAALYGFILGSLLSGSFVVEVVTSWPGLGRLMYDALRARDLFLVAGCAAAGSIFLAVRQPGLGPGPGVGRPASSGSARTNAARGRRHEDRGGRDARARRPRWRSPRRCSRLTIRATPIARSCRRRRWGRTSSGRTERGGGRSCTR